MTEKREMSGGIEAGAAVEALPQLLQGWLPAAVRCRSPNFNSRPAQAEVNLLVIHNISLPPGQFGGGHIEAFFSNNLAADDHPYFATIADLQVSAHFLISRQGRVTQFVGCDERAWHAGQSCFQGQSDCNDFSLGVELEGTDDQPYTQAQYQSLVGLSLRLMEAYPAVTIDRITGHSDIAPGRKTDPGPCFDWAYYRQLLGRALDAGS